jgi:hypothetical protein
MTFSYPTSTFLRAVAVTFVLVTSFAARASGQLRPLDPTDFRALNGERARVQVGVGVYYNQFASLVGTTGRLIEAGDVRASYRSGRIVIELAGTLQRFYREEKVINAPAEGVTESSQEGTRHDAGDYRVQTVLRLTGDTVGMAGILRFGTRLPTTDNRVGLERDQTDFFATLGTVFSSGKFFFGAEAGVGIHGTRLTSYEQSDVLIYAATIERRAALVSPFLSVTGQNDMHGWSVRGNEDLGEVRAGLRVGNTRWLAATFVHGYHRSSPDSGFLISLGSCFGRH